MPDRLGDKIRLQHILSALAEIKAYTDGVDFEAFSQNSMMINASIRQLEIIGEACNRISHETMIATPDIQWRQIIGLRNILIHQYFGVDLQVV